MEMKKSLRVALVLLICAVVLCGCGKQTPDAEPAATEAAPVQSTEAPAEVFAGMMDGTIAQKDSRMALQCDVPYRVTVNGKTAEVKELLFAVSDMEAASRMEGLHVRVKVRDIQEEAGAFVLTSEFVEGEELLVPMDGFTASYPAQWGEYLTVRCEEKGSILEYTFLCRYENKEYPLFAVLTGAGIEDIFGFMLLPEREVEIGLTSFDAELPEGADETLTGIFNGMQEDINELIGSLQENPVFNPGV